MRALLWASLLSIAMPGLCNAGEVRTEIAISGEGKAVGTDAHEQSYRGYYLDLSKFADRHDFAVLSGELRHQLDIVDSVGLSPQALKFFHTIPIVADETACLEKPLTVVACYGLSQRSHRTSSESTVWDSEKSQWSNTDPIALAEDTRRGIVMVRPLIMLNAKGPVILHELLHAYHSQIMPQAYENVGILHHYN